MEPRGIPASPPTAQSWPWDPRALPNEEGLTKTKPDFTDMKVSFKTKQNKNNRPDMTGKHGWPVISRHKSSLEDSAGLSHELSLGIVKCGANRMENN